MAGGPPPADRGAPGDPADRVTLDDNVRLALLVVLQRLSPAERVDRDQARPVLRAAFGPVERGSFRMFGIRQYLLLRRAGS